MTHTNDAFHENSLNPLFSIGVVINYIVAQDNISIYQDNSCDQFCSVLATTIFGFLRAKGVPFSIPQFTALFTSFLAYIAGIKPASEVDNVSTFSPRSSFAVAAEGSPPQTKVGAVVTSSRASKRR